MHSLTQTVVAATILAGVTAAADGVRGEQTAPAKPQPSRAEAIVAVRTVMADARYATFITLDDTGHPQARIVDPFPPEDDMTIWIATNARSRKVGQIEAEPRVTLTYFDAGQQSYVTVLGVARAVRDPRERARLWKDEWAAFYKDRNRGDDYLLIRVTPRRLEVVSERLGMTNDPVTWRPVVVDLPAPAGSR